MSKEVKRWDELKALAEAAYERAPFPDMNNLDPQNRKFMAGANSAAVLELLAERDALLAERDALAKDAERYRYLRQHLLGVSFDWNDEGITALEFEMPAGIRIGADCDKNIDAARAALQGAQP